ncbi:arsenate reductase (glutaredoxin) [Terasakiispira papahanaumokuakeensis]|uniref:Arsenate reductase n=1 Tax=Terasakiispira papahanaumokuakeensis TaxID=197479 RepID=A0A1E2V9A1_9GAMM|nr:arsenate reductase (glutaredoxin) [Terasakiispira papahanaumokuakeensis]ODC03588.1 arsenate reductase (glutaredoxin) [Terasakiispira papahanaumokuakeensis]
MTITLYHNPRCSKSRQALQLLQDNGVEPIIHRYLDQPLDADALRQLIQRTGLSTQAIMRSNEDEFKAANLGREDITDDELIEALVKTPKLLQRPIADDGQRAIIGRPPEDVLALLSP